eukprot:jgi/Mesvir1/19335/Mv10393-RA.1
MMGSRYCRVQPATPGKEADSDTPPASPGEPSLHGRGISSIGRVAMQDPTADGGPKRKSFVMEKVTSFMGGRPQESSRTLHVNNREANQKYMFRDNAISTTKYSFLSFIPKGLYEQFRRLANCYFLGIAIISTTPLSPVHPITNMGPLLIVLLVSLIKEGFEDVKRHRKDMEVNRSTTEVLVGETWTTVMWHQVQVGDIVRVHDKRYFPADLVLLSSSNPDGVCYIETANLDGETNLKIRKCLERTWSYNTEKTLSSLNAMVECEPPNNHLYTFIGNLILNGKEVIPLAPPQILLRGCSLRNTGSIVGVAVFTGGETKVMMNTTAVPSKRSTLEHTLDRLILFLFVVLFVICLLGALGSGMFIDAKYWYLGLEDADIVFNPKRPIIVGFLNFFTLLTLYSTIIPISLYVSIEMIKVIQVTHFFNKDLSMYHAESDTPALARTSNLNEELGQVSFIFSDKTGTLTQNQMEFFKCSVGGVSYGQGITEIQRANAKRNNQTLLEPAKLTGDDVEPGFNFSDTRLLNGTWTQEPARASIEEFCRLLAVCHTVLPEGKETPKEIVYQASSPDELALVVAAKRLGFFFYRRTPTSVFVREMHHQGGAKDVEYKILNVLEFNSTRKRQSVVCRHPSGAYVLYCKGADNVIYDRLERKANKELSPANSHAAVTSDHLAEFGEDGLRTLCLAYRLVPAEEYERWNKAFVEAKQSLVDREKKLDEAAELIEVNLTLLGCTAIEDKLQDGVPDAIEKLAAAGIKIWVLTGDKLETAINVSYACSLLSNAQKKFIIDSECPEVEAAEKLANKEEAQRRIQKEVLRQLEAAEVAADKIAKEEASMQRDLAMVIDGKMLSHALHADVRERFLAFGMRCVAVVCCRVSPLQKAQVTSLVKQGKTKHITLAIGDGANDVSMIQAAHVGVGISGQEGMQAVMSSDFAIAQFRFLVPLLLVHGRYSYLRIAKVVGYFFYKNIAFTLTQFWFNNYAGFSGQRFYDDWYQSFYNLVFTSMPVIILGLFDQDVSPSVSKANPQLYREGQINHYFNLKSLSLWLLSALYQSLICFYVPALAMGPVATQRDGKMMDLWGLGTLAYSCIIMTVNMRLAMLSSFQTFFHHLFVWGSIACWYTFILLYTAMLPGQSGELDKMDNVYYVFYILMESPSFWLCLTLVPFLSLAPDLLVQGLERWFWPRWHHLLQERELLQELVEDLEKAYGAGPASILRRTATRAAMLLSCTPSVTPRGRPGAPALVESPKRRRILAPHVSLQLSPCCGSLPLLAHLLATRTCWLIRYRPFCFRRLFEH